ncbi:uroporphyrinogen-III synthase [Campylobacter devanensis]|uniref:Uroporphyrinogen III synthase n=1 Tax=Campylobacter devanensis TaxID=3161138 RepID=A0A1X9SRH7_9BACT|nr:uroporphyrinogen-III synthase [Campylobacter lanienae]ARQ98847.1 uroporphyrinogen III synthase [Campylobacter lanienae]SUX01913.1 uroporphyrinogen-III synthase [Campylobacter lanienae]
MIYLISNTPFDDESVEQISLCDIKFNKFNIDLSEFDALIVTSKNGINSLKFNSITLADILVFAIGKATALSCKEFGFTQIYEAQNSHGSEFGAEILEKLYGKKVLFIKAKETISNLDIYFNQNGIDISVIDGYENLILKKDISSKPKSNSILLFTSPINVRAFIQNLGWDDSYKAVAIGKATAQALKPYTDPIISKSQTIKDCVELAKSLK